MKLFKSLKSALSNKDEVTHLKLTLKVEFPKEIFQFQNLRELYLDGECEMIPKLTPLKRLELLALTSMNFKEGLEEVLCHPHLRNLKLIGLKLPEFSIPSLSELSPLLSLTLKECGLREISPAIARFHLLSELNLDGNLLSKLPNEFKSLHFLKRLNLDRNDFKTFPSVLSELNSLKHVSLDGNSFDEEEKARIQREYHLTVH